MLDAPVQTPTSIAAKAAQKKLETRQFYVIGGLLLLTVTAIVVGWLTVVGDGKETALWFVALLIIFMTATASTAAVFAGLRLAAPGEAFGLPSGSIRALLAIGVMVLLVVFGLRYISTDRDPPTRVADTFVAAEALAGERERYEDRGYLVIVLEPGVPASAAPGAPQPRLAKLALYKTAGLAGPDMELLKQILTAIITLLTTVIGFYFGSRSAVEGKTGDESAGGRSLGLSADLLADRKNIGAALDAARATFAPIKSELGQIAVLPLSAVPEEAEARKAAETAAKTAASALEALLTTATESLAAFDAASAVMDKTADPDARAVQEAEARQALAKAKTAIEGLPGAQAAAQLGLDTLSKLMAEG